MHNFCYLPLLLAACATSPQKETPAPEYQLSVTAERVSPDQILVTANLSGSTGDLIVLPKVIMLAGMQASIFVGDEHADDQDPDGIEGLILSEGNLIVFQARVVEDGVERWSDEQRVMVEN